jgi:hypothetical protein
MLTRRVVPYELNSVDVSYSETQLLIPRLRNIELMPQKHQTIPPAHPPYKNHTPYSH